MTTPTLSPRNNVAPTCTLAVITPSREYLCKAYMDHHAVAMDRLAGEQEAIRLEAIEAVGTVTADSMAGIVAGLIDAIGSCDTIEALLESPGYSVAMGETAKLSGAMAKVGNVRRLASILNARTRHVETEALWILAVYLEISGDIDAYFGVHDAWPRIEGDAAAQFEAVRTRTSSLLTVGSLEIKELLAATGRHISTHAELMRGEVKNSKRPSTQSDE